MQFVVLVAFAIVLMPSGKMPWPAVASGPWTLMVVLGQTVAIAAWGLFSTRRVLRHLDASPVDTATAQRLHARDSAMLGFLALTGWLASMWATDWPQQVRDLWGLDRIHGLDELILLAPMFASVIAGWATMFPADRAIRQLAMEANLREGLPVHPPWGFGAYLLFLVRHQLLLIVVPMALIVVANDAVQDHARYLRSVTRLWWADQAVLVAVAGAVLLFSPLMLRVIWSTSALPQGELRERLAGVSRRLRLKYRDILVWHSQGMVVNAAVMGILPPVRYLMLSDGLLERMDDEQIEAVFGHEAGHVKLLHIPYYMLFAVLSMLIVGGVCELVRWGLHTWASVRLGTAYMTMLAAALVVIIWGLAFGWISRRFERQADVFGARVVSPPAEGCVLPCRVHHTGDVPPNPHSLCATGAALFADALGHIARLNGIPEEARSWRHSSIGSRIRFLRGLAEDPERVRRFARTLTAVRVILVAGTAAGLALAVWLYVEL